MGELEQSETLCAVRTVCPPDDCVSQAASDFKQRRADADVRLRIQRLSGFVISWGKCVDTVKCLSGRRRIALLWRICAAGGRYGRRLCLYRFKFLYGTAVPGFAEAAAQIKMASCRKYGG